MSIRVRLHAGFELGPMWGEPEDYHRDVDRLKEVLREEVIAVVEAAGGPPAMVQKVEWSSDFQRGREVSDEGNR